MLERHAVRGFWVRLDEAWRELGRHQQYAPSVEALLGEALSATVLLAATLKFQGTLTLQLTGDGLGTLLVAQCTHELQVRAVGHAAATLPEEPSFAQLIGHGRLSVTIENDEQAARYQGIVSLEGANLAACLENYFATSEQLPTSVALSADADRAAGGLGAAAAPGRCARCAAAARRHDGAGRAAGLHRARCAAVCGGTGALRVPLQRRPGRDAAACARTGRTAGHHRRAGHGDRDLRVLRPTVPTRCDRRRAAVQRGRQSAGSAVAELSDTRSGPKRKGREVRIAVEVILLLGALEESDDAVGGRHHHDLPGALEHILCQHHAGEPLRFPH